MSPAQADRAVAPFWGVIRLPFQEFGALAPTVQMYSTARETLTFLGANVGLVQSPLYPAMTNAQSPRFPTGTGARTGMHWQTWRSGAVSCVERGGWSGAFSGYTGLMPDQKRAVVVLGTGFQSVTELGRYLLSPAFPKFPAFPVPKQVPTSVLRRYVGTFTGAWASVPERSVDIRLERGHLTFVWSGDNWPWTLYPAPSAKTNIFRLPPGYETSTSTVQFNFDNAGQVVSLYWNGSWGAAGPIPKVASLSLPPELALLAPPQGPRWS